MKVPSMWQLVTSSREWPMRNMIPWLVLSATMAVIGDYRARAQDAPEKEPGKTKGAKRRTARKTLTDFLSFALSGKDDEACALSDPRKAVCRQIPDLRQLAGSEKLRIRDVYVDYWEALAITTSADGSRDRAGPLLITARREQSAGKWLVVDMDFEDPGDVERKVEEFRREHPAAQRTLSEAQEAARKALQEFLALLLASKDGAALQFVDRKKISQRTLNNLRTIEGFSKLVFEKMYANDEAALAVSSRVVTTAGRQGVLVFYAKRRKGKWLIDLADFQTQERLRARVKRFRKKHPDAWFLSVPWHKKATDDCVANLRRYHNISFEYSQTKNFFPYSPKGPLAAFHILLNHQTGKSLLPENFVCPLSGDKPAKKDKNGKFLLREENCSYEIVPWKNSPLMSAILMYDKKPHHGGKRLVVFNNGKVSLLEETKFQKRIARDDRRYRTRK